MRLHDKGQKADRDRAVVLHSYQEMCKFFHVPHSARLTPVQLTKMTNTQIYQAGKDLYNGATVAQAHKLAVKLGVYKQGENAIVAWIKALFAPRKLHVAPKHV